MNGILQLVIEFLYFVVGKISRWGVRLQPTTVMLKGTALRLNGNKPAGEWAAFNDSVRDVFVNKKSNTMPVLIFFSTEKTNVLPLVSPKRFRPISQSPRMFHLYLFSSCVSSWSFPAAVSVLVFLVPMVICLFNESWTVHR